MRQLERTSNPVSLTRQPTNGYRHTRRSPSRRGGLPSTPGGIGPTPRRRCAATVHRMHHEFGKAYQQYRGAAEAFQPVAHFHQMAQQHGTTLEKALDSYTGIEDQAAQEPGRRAGHTSSTTSA